MSKALKSFFSLLLALSVLAVCSSPSVALSSEKSKKEKIVPPKESKPSAEKKSEKKPTLSRKEKKIFKEYLDYFEKIYDTMDQSYYQPLDRSAYDSFITKFKDDIYPQLLKEKKSDNYVRWRGAAYLVDYLKSKEDIFSALFPPEPAKHYEQTALGVRMDVGIEGEKADAGFRVTQVEPRADSYDQGLRINDIIININGIDVKTKAVQEINELLTPLVDTKVRIHYLDSTRSEKMIEVSPREYFKQTVFPKPVHFSGVFCFEIRRFSQKTSEDLMRFLMFAKQQKNFKGLILDLRGNPGGPPLAAREISAFFLTPGEEFAYFQKKGQPKALLDVPKLPERFHYDGPLVILIDKGSGSSSELFSGVMHKLKRATLMGRNSAGQVMLKSMFHFDDQSMLLLVTARGHYPDGDVFSFGGLVPDYPIRPTDDDRMVDFAAYYLTTHPSTN